MEIHAGIQRAIECAWLAGKLEANAVGKDEDTARSLFRAAAKYRAGQHLALADVVSERLGRAASGSALGPAGQRTQRHAAQPGESGGA